MAVLDIRNFGGELPSTSPRALPINAAQVNSNLLALSREFRPLPSDGTVGVAPVGTQTLYRLSKDSSGELHTSDTAGWIAETIDKNYVRGQINDDGTERTYVTFNDGSQEPRAIDATGEDRLMGIPAPESLTTEATEGEAFTKSDADAWYSDVLLTAVSDAVTASLMEAEPGAHVNGGTPIAGPYSFHGLTYRQRNPNDYHGLHRYVPASQAVASGLDDPRIEADTSTSPGNYIIGITAIPLWGQINKSTLVAGLQAIEDPKSGEALFTAEQCSSYADGWVDKFNPNDGSLSAMRNSLDDAVTAFVAALDFAITPAGTAPTAPVPPNVSISANPALWASYDTALAAYTVSLAAHNAAKTKVATDKSSRIAAIVELQARCWTLSKAIQDLYFQLKEEIPSTVSSDFGARALVQEPNNENNGLVSVDPDRLTESRFYFATYTDDWGQESAPSPVTDMLTVDQYSTVTLTVADAPSGRSIEKWTLYRSNVGNSGASFQFVEELPIAEKTYIDEKDNAELLEVCPTVTWAEPPFRIDSGASTEESLVAKGPNPYLRGLVGMPNGVMAGFIDNFVAFCDPYHPYAWPVEYQISLKYPVVGLGVFGQSLFVGTLANPSIISGSDSASMSEQVMDDSQACRSARSIVSMGGGVLYSSPDGICFASGNGVQVITTELFAREDWQALQPDSIKAVAHEGIYYFWYSGTYDGVTGGCLALDTTAKKLVRVDINASAVFADSLTDAVFYVSGTQIKRAFSTGRRTGRWKSSKTSLPSHAAMAWLQVYGDHSSTVPAIVRWYGDGELRYTGIVTGIAPMRLPPGRWLEHEIEIESAARITSVTLAGHTLELQKI